MKMLQLLLDIVPYPDGQKPIPVVPRVVEKTVVPDTATQAPPVTDSASIQQVADTASASRDALFSVGTGTDDTSLLWWSVAVVAILLIVCIYCIQSYRRYLTTGHN